MSHQRIRSAIGTRSDDAPYEDWPRLKAEGEAAGYTTRRSGVAASSLARFIVDSTSDRLADTETPTAEYMARIDAWLTREGSPTTTRDHDHRLLDAYVRARNARLSSEAQAVGHVSGRAVANLRMDRAAETKALTALGDWVEQQARIALGQEIPGTVAEASR